MTTKEFTKNLRQYQTTSKAVLVPSNFRKDLEKQGLRYDKDGAWLPDLTQIEFV